MKKRMLKAVGLCMAVSIMCSWAVFPVKAASGTWRQHETTGKWWYEYANGGYPSNRWEQIDGQRYWFDGNGYMATGWQSIAGSWYYFDSQGIMLTGLQEIEGKQYLLAEDGRMMVGWHRIDGNWRYFAVSGGAWIDNNIHEQGSIKGIDVSRWQGDIDWAAVKNYGIQFAFIRVGHGTHSLDTYYQKNMREANAVGLPVGVYFYSTATTTEQSIRDAQFVIENLKGYTVSYPVVVDVEDRETQGNLSKEQVTAIAKVFCDEIRAAGYTPMIYCDEDWYRNKIDASQLEDVEKWIARYNVTHSESIPRGIWQACGTGRIDGIKGNVDIDFAYKDYTQLVTPRTAPVESYSMTKGTWQWDRNGWWYSYFDGGYPAGKWERIGREWYYFNNSGYMMVGWQYVNGQWYYIDDNGAMATGWRNIGGTWYYLEESGIMATGWRQVDGQWYYMNASGAMQIGWLKLGGTWYYLDGNGAMATGWRQVNGIWYYMDGNGAMATGWRQVDGQWYYMSESGAMQKGWIRIGNFWYYLHGNGAMATGWLKLGDNWYYLDEGGAMAADTWIDNYYVNASGVWTSTR